MKIFFYLFAFFMTWMSLYIDGSYSDDQVNKVDGGISCSRVNHFLDGNLSGGNWDNSSKINMGFSGFYTKDDSIFAVGFVTSDKSRVIVFEKIYPEIEILEVEEVPFRLKNYPSGIQSALSQMKMLNSEYMIDEGKAYDVCDPLSYVVSGNRFSDAKPRKFIRSYLDGKRNQTSNRYCEVWGQRDYQFLFYESFIPIRVENKEQKVFIDNEYLGVMDSLSGNFQYPCNIKNFVQSKAVLSGKKRASLVMRDDAYQYLFDRGLRSFSKEDVADNDQVWQMQILRNIIEGQDLLRGQGD